MAGTVRIPQARNTAARDARRTWLTAVLAALASIGMMTLATPGTVSPVAYWVVSSIALATVLVVLVAGEHAWDEMLDSARAAGVVER